MARPSDYTQELADRICVLLSEGKSLRTVCKAEDMPDASTIFRWIRSNEEFCKQYTRAKQESSDAWAEELHDIVDEVAVDKEAINKARLQVDTRKWLMAKMKPKKYGEKLDLTTDGEKLPTPIMAVDGAIKHVQSDNGNKENIEPDEED